ncbi:MAG TPA: xanthine dehydrogenase family protein molybdopterin-binding subunit [Acidimicrobiales bacterium]|nr:xanthine dehydrogenase family protein molybdopterin-binding subunit [Acidimicrobiales bacterium]
MNSTTGETESAARFVGQSIKRREDPRLVTGHGRYLDDVVLPGMLHATFLRSDIARGVITRVEVEAARSAPGVHAVFAGRDLNAVAGPIWASAMPPSPELPYAPLQPMADGDVRFVGDLIALVVADNRYLAEDAAELIEVDIDPRPPVTFDNALDTNERVHPGQPSNVAQRLPASPDPELDAIFASAAHVVTRTFKEARATNVPMEGRGLVAQWDPYAGDMRIWASTQNPYELRAAGSRIIGVGEHNIRVVMGDVGGGFGQKVFITREEASVMLAAKLLGKAVKWVEDRRENLISANQSRGELATMSMAFDTDGRILAAKLGVIDEAGAYPTASSGSANAFAAMMFTGPYRIPRISFDGVTVYTNSCGRAAYRGPWLIESVAREQMMDHAARDLGIDPVELRRRNLVTQADLPFTMPSGLVYDIMTCDLNLEQAVQIVGYDAFRAEQRWARAQGRYLGLGVSLFVEPSAVAQGVWSTEAATIRIDSNGKVSVLMGTASHGHSLETTIPQVVADYLGCHVDDVTLIQGDTAVAPYGPGTGGSRSAVLAGGAARQASIELNQKLRRIAGHVLEASEDDMVITDSRVHVRGTPTKGLAFAELAPLAYMAPEMLPPGVDPGLEVTTRYRASAPFTWSNAAHLCTCELDTETGLVKLLRYIVSEDCGVMINPMVVEGQIAGGVVQGIGGVLFEDMAYDPGGNPLATTFLDYLVPTAAEVPSIEYGHIETPSNMPGGYKGMGEGGAIGSPACVANAVADALAGFGADVAANATTFPLGPSQILALLNAE